MLDWVVRLQGSLIAQDVPAVLFWSYVIVGMLMQGIGKSGFAGGVGILTFPLLSLVMRVDRVAAVMLPMLCLFDLNAVFHYRHDKDLLAVKTIYFPSLAGIVLGGATWWMMGDAGIGRFDRPLKVAVGCIAILFACYILFRRIIIQAVGLFRPGWKTACVTGLAAGFLSTIAHAAGPLVSLYMYIQGMNKTMFVGTVAWTFALINFSKLPMYLCMDLFTPNTLAMTLLLCPLVPVGSFLGRFLHDRVSERLFHRVIMLCVTAAGVQLISGVDVVRWILGKG